MERVNFASTLSLEFLLLKKNFIEEFQGQVEETLQQ